MVNRYRRIGEVTATELSEAREWTTSEGDHLISQPGDMWVVDDDGVGRGVARDRFLDTHEPTEVPGRFRRTGTVTARRVHATETVSTLEGPSIAQPGMWVLTDMHGDSWPVTDEFFARNYLEDRQPLDS